MGILGMDLLIISSRYCLRFLSILFIGSILLTNCVPYDDRPTVPTPVAKVLDHPEYHLVLARFSGDLEVYERILEANADEHKLSPATIAKEEFLDAFKSYPDERKTNYVILNPEEVGICDTIVAEEPVDFEGLSRSESIQLTDYALRRLNELDISGVFVIDIKRLTIELDSLSKWGRAFTYTIIGAMWGGPMWGAGDYALSVSVDYHYLSKDNSFVWQTEDAYAELAGDRYVKYMPHAIEFKDMKKEEIMKSDVISAKLEKLFNIYSSHAVKTYFGDSTEIPTFTDADDA